MTEWHDYVVAKRKEDLENIIKEERLKPEETRKFLENAFRDGEIKTAGTDIDKLMPPVENVLRRSKVLSVSSRLSSRSISELEALHHSQKNRSHLLITHHRNLP